jgi:hypothetical protein
MIESKLNNLVKFNQIFFPKIYLEKYLDKIPELNPYFINLI